MIIKDDCGLPLKLTKTHLIQAEGDSTDCSLELKNLITAKRRVMVQFNEVMDPNEDNRPFPVVFDRAERSIGCCTFDEKTFAKIMNAAAKTENK